MATLFKRLNWYCHHKNQPHLTLEERMDLGRIVAQKYWEWKHPKTAVQYAVYEDAERGNVRVVAYPGTFISQIDTLIDQYYKRLHPPPKLRKRIPAKPNPIYSHKK